MESVGMPYNGNNNWINEYEGTVINVVSSGTDTYVSTNGPVESNIKVYKNNHTGEISVSLYVKYVKNKFTKLQLEKMKSRISKLSKMVQTTADLGQQALYENLSRMLAIVVRESEAYACGINKFIDRKDLMRFQVKDKVIKFDLLDRFPRPIPKSVIRKINGCKDKNLFDQYHVLYIDYTGEVLKTNKEKIREKDPILFGCYNYQPDRFYYICDWIDEYCDLTLDKLVDGLKETDPEFALSEVPDLDQKAFDMIKQEVKARQERLNNTRSSNYKNLMNEEDEKNAKSKTIFGKPLLSKFISKFKKKKQDEKNNNA